MPRVYIPLDTQRIVAARAQGRCEYCQSWADYATETFAVEHIVPLSRGGTSTLENLALACSGCNGHKYNRVVEALHLNRPGLVNIRQVLYTVGKHPPNLNEG